MFLNGEGYEADAQEMLIENSGVNQKQLISLSPSSRDRPELRRPIIHRMR
jgi:hypothetical protein